MTGATSASDLMLSYNAVLAGTKFRFYGLFSEPSDEELNEAKEHVDCIIIIHGQHHPIGTFKGYFTEKGEVEEYIPRNVALVNHTELLFEGKVKDDIPMYDTEAMIKCCLALMGKNVATHEKPKYFSDEEAPLTAFQRWEEIVRKYEEGISSDIAKEFYGSKDTLPQ